MGRRGNGWVTAPGLDGVEGRTHVARTVRMISLRRLLSKLTVLALSASAAAAGATPDAPDARRGLSCDDCDDDAPIDREHVDPHDAAVVLGRSLAKALSELPELDAIHLSTTWALSQDPVRRAGLAHALEWEFRLMPDRLILEHLSKDEDPMIRAACARAAWIRGIGPQAPDERA